MILLALSFSLNAHAVDLPEITPSTQQVLPIDTSAPLIACDKIAEALNDYGKLANQHDLAVYNFLGEVTNKVNSWYELLVPLENTQQTLPVGVFLPLQDGANKISGVSDIALENTGLLAAEMDRIKTSLAQCNVTPK